MVDWDLFRIFHAVCRTGSVNKAASELGLSQATLSRRMKQLEQYVNAPLLFRTPTGVELTEEGEQLRLSTSGMLSTFDLFEKEITSRIRDRSSIVRISTSEGMAKHWLLPRAKRLRAIDSSLYLEIMATSRKLIVSEDDFDFVIRVGEPGHGELVGKRVGSLAFGVFASRAYLSSNGRPRSLSELDGHDIVGHAYDLARLAKQESVGAKLAKHFAKAAEERSAIRVLPASHQFSAASEGLGLALLAVPFALAEGLVQVIPDEITALDIWLLRRREADLRRFTRRIGKLLEGEFRQSKDWLAGRPNEK